MKAFDNSVLERQEAQNELEALSYEAKNVETDAGLLTYFKR